MRLKSCLGHMGGSATLANIPRLIMISIQSSTPRFSAVIQHLFHDVHRIEMAGTTAEPLKEQMPVLYGVQVYLTDRDVSAVYLYESKDRAETVLNFVQDTNQLPRKLIHDGQVEFRCYTPAPTKYQGHEVILVTNGEEVPECAS